MTRIAILHPGEMGSAIGGALIDVGHEVYWLPRGRGPARVRRASQAGLLDPSTLLGCDGVSDTLPGLPPEGWVMPIHQCAIVAMGVHLLDNLRLDRLADACAAHGRWSFLFTVAPLVVEGGTGSPANPIALL